MVQKRHRGSRARVGTTSADRFRAKTGQAFFIVHNSISGPMTDPCLLMFPPCLLMFPPCLPMCRVFFSSAVSSHVPGVSSHVPAFFRTQKPYRSRFGSRESVFCIVNNSIFRFDPRIDSRIDSDSDPEKVHSVL